jgi:hypothetical protein
VQQLFEDAGAVLQLVDQRPWLPEADVRELAATRGITADRFAAAVALLQEAGEVHALPDDGVTLALAPDLPEILDTLTVDDLQDLGRIYEVDGRSSMTKPELIEALGTLRSGESRRDPA